MALIRMLFSSASTTRIQLQPLNQEVLLLACSLLFTSFVWFRLIRFCGRLLTNSYYTSRFFCKTSKKNVQIKVQAKMLLKVMTAADQTSDMGSKQELHFPIRSEIQPQGSSGKCLQFNRTHFFSSQIELIRPRFPTKALP